MCPIHFFPQKKWIGSTKYRVQKETRQNKKQKEKISSPDCFQLDSSTLHGF